MKDGMDFVEGSYCVEDGGWHVFIIRKASLERAQISPVQWQSGVTGIVIRVPLATCLNKPIVQRFLSEWLGVEVWQEVQGPDSIQLR
jgi:hypothetical protein